MPRDERDGLRQVALILLSTGAALVLFPLIVIFGAAFGLVLGIPLLVLGGALYWAARRTDRWRT